MTTPASQWICHSPPPDYERKVMATSSLDGAIWSRLGGTRLGRSTFNFASCCFPEASAVQQCRRQMARNLVVINEVSESTDLSVAVFEQILHPLSSVAPEVRYHVAVGAHRQADL